MAWERELQVAIEAARAAEVVHRNGRLGVLEVSTKSSEVDLVTQVDVESEARIRQVILASFPGDAILGEEEGAIGDSPRMWVVDPLDGTVNYAHGFPVYCVSIGLTVDRERVVAVVLDTARGELFTATKGGGAFMEGAPIRVSGTQQLSKAMLATGFAYASRWQGENLKWFGKLLGECRAIRRPGAAAIDLAWLAAGRIDGFWELCLKPWDTAAGSLLVEEAGGTVTGVGGAQWAPGHPMIIASNRRIHRQLVASLSD